MPLFPVFDEPTRKAFLLTEPHEHLQRTIAALQALKRRDLRSPENPDTLGRLACNLANLSRLWNRLTASIPEPTTTPEPQPALYTTGNEGLGNDIATLSGIFDGEYDGHDVETQLRHVAHNLGVLRNLHIERMN